MPEELKMGLLENGLDDLAFAVSQSLPTATPTQCKHAVKSLASGVALVFKEKLRRLDPSLLFEDRAAANAGDLATGDFISVGLDKARQRLATEGITLPNRAASRLRGLQNRRNRIEHYALIDTRDAIDASTASVLSVAVDFIEDHLGVATLSERELALLQGIRDRLSELDAFVKTRRQDISAPLVNAQKSSLVVTCPLCLQDTLVLELEGPNCLFCRHSGTAVKVASEYVTVVMGCCYHLVLKDGGEWPLRNCPACDVETLVLDNGPDRPGTLCFSCSSVVDVDFCLKCGEPVLASEELTICEACFEYAVDRDT